MAKLGPCNADCEGCKWLYRPGSDCVPLCDYYLKNKGFKHRYAGPDGTCAVWQPKRPGITRQPAKREKKPQRAVSSWDKDAALAMYLRGALIKDIAAAMGTSKATISKYASRNWYHYKAQRNDAKAATQQEG